jgi:hypothetical protein
VNGLGAARQVQEELAPQQRRQFLRTQERPTIGIEA